MAEGEERLGPGGVNTVRVTVPKGDATVGGIAKATIGVDDVEVEIG